jgi:hypothetical protein
VPVLESPVAGWSGVGLSVPAWVVVVTGSVGTVVVSSTPSSDPDDPPATAAAATPEPASNNVVATAGSHFLALIMAFSQ